MRFILVFFFIISLLTASSFSWSQDSFSTGYQIGAEIAAERRAIARRERQRAKNDELSIEVVKNESFNCERGDDFIDLYDITSKRVSIFDGFIIGYFSTKFSGWTFDIYDDDKLVARANISTYSSSAFNRYGNCEVFIRKVIREEGWWLWKKKILEGFKITKKEW